MFSEIGPIAEFFQIVMLLRLVMLVFIVVRMRLRRSQRFSRGSPGTPAEGPHATGTPHFLNETEDNEDSTVMQGVKRDT